MAAPAYEVGDVVYLRESAAIGHLEAVRISGIMRNGASWLYSVSASLSSPLHASHYGDKILHVNSKLLHFTEAEFVTKCEALSLARDNVSAMLDNLDAQIANQCEEDA